MRRAVMHVEQANDGKESGSDQRLCSALHAHFTLFDYSCSVETFSLSNGLNVTHDIYSYM